jgi:hypothetical protein
MESLHSKDAPLQNVVVRKAKDLDKFVRIWVCSLFGRELADDEQVSVALPGIAGEQVATGRSQARRQLLDSMDRLSQRFQNVPAEQLDAALDEAMKAARPSYEPQH